MACCLRPLYRTNFAFWSAVTCRRTLGVVKSWVTDGAVYGEKFVLLPKVGKSPLWPNSSMPLKSDSSKDVIAALNILKAEVDGGKLNNQIYSAVRAQKKTSKKTGFAI